MQPSRLRSARLRVSPGRSLNPSPVPSQSQSLKSSGFAHTLNRVLPTAGEKTSTDSCDPDTLGVPGRALLVRPALADVVVATLCIVGQLEHDRY